MTTYEDESMHDVRATFEASVLRWPNVGTKKMFGCPSYLAGNKLFAFFVNEGLVLTKLSESQRDELADVCTVEPFRSGTRIIQSWMRAPVSTPNELDGLMPYVTESYQAALDEALTEQAQEE